MRPSSSCLPAGEEGGDSINNIPLAATQTEDHVKGQFLLDIVVGEGATILEPLAGEDETMLTKGNVLLILNLCLHVVDYIE